MVPGPKLNIVQRGERTDGQMNAQTDGRKISLFYRTLFPIGAAALLPKGPLELDPLMPLGDSSVFRHKFDFKLRKTTL